MNPSLSLSVSPNFLNPGVGVESFNLEIEPFSLLPVLGGAAISKEAGVAVINGCNRFIPKTRLFGWYFLGCGVLLLGYALFPFLPSLTWKLGFASDAVKERAIDLAVSNVLVEQYSDLDYVLGYVPKNNYAYRSMWEDRADLAAELVEQIAAQEPKSQKEDETRKQTAALTSKKPVFMSASRKSPAVKTIASRIIPAAEAKSQIEEVKQVPRDYRILIPSIKVNAPVFGGDEQALEKGVWHLPGTALPGEGNTVMSGHRQDQFYHLDKVKVGDEIVVYRGGVEFRYKVERTRIVKPNDTSMLNKTNDSRLVLITCEPLVAMTYRIIIEAVQI